MHKKITGYMEYVLYIHVQKKNLLVAEKIKK